MQSYDLIIYNGRICDGTGNPSYHADIGVIGDKIAYIGALADAQAKQTIDAKGFVVSPGFVDLHNHVDHGILAFPDVESYIMQGVTTSVVGNCGLSMAPLSDAHKDETKGYLKPFLDKKMDYGWDWRSLSEFYAKVEKSGTIQNLAPLVGQGTLRLAVKGFDPSPSTPEEMAQMKNLLREELEAGAFGMSSGLIYPPGSYTTKEELIELCSVLSEFNAVYTTHLRNEGDRLIQSLDEAIAVGEANHIPVEISHHKAAGRYNWGKVNATLRIMQEARGRGVDVSCDVYPYPASMTTITSLLPSKNLEGGVAKLLTRLADPACRAEMESEIANNRMPEENVILSNGWDKIMISECAIATQYEGKMLSEIIAGRNPADPFGSFFDWLIEVKCEAMMVMFSMDEADVSTVIKSPLSVIISDSWVTAPRAGGKPHPRGYGSFPRLLGKYVREEKLLSLEDGVRKITSMPAAKVGLSDRGLVKKGFFADLVVFDADKITDKATYTDPHNYPEGIEHVVVNGKVVVTRCQLQGARPGRVLKRG